MVFDKRYFIGFFISVIFIGIMAAVSDLIGVTEVIFPEAAALLFGSFIMIRMPWNVRHVTMTAEMTACAAAGLIISRYADMPIYFKMLLAAAIVFVMLTVGGNTLTPSVSACVLPVLVGTKDWIYIASVFVIAAVCDIGSFIIEKRDTKESRRRFERRKDMLPLWSRMFAVLAVILLIPGISGELYLTAPPADSCVYRAQRSRYGRQRISKSADYDIHRLFSDVVSRISVPAPWRQFTGSCCSLRDGSSCYGLDNNNSFRTFLPACSGVGCAAFYTAGRGALEISCRGNCRHRDILRWSDVCSMADEAPRR